MGSRSQRFKAIAANIPRSLTYEKNDYTVKRKLLRLLKYYLAPSSE